jgi:hypothetical protein
MAKINKNEVYEGDVYEVENEDLIPVETDEATDDGMSTGGIVAITALVTAGAILLGTWIKGKVDKHREKKAAAAAEDNNQYHTEPAPDEDFEEA